MWDTVGRIVMMIATTITKMLITTLRLMINSSLWSNVFFFEKIVQDFMNVNVNVYFAKKGKDTFVL